MKVIPVDVNGRNEIRWAVQRGDKYFCFFVDGTKASWTKKLPMATCFRKEVDAHEAFVEIQRRDKLNRDAKREGSTL